MSVHALPVVMGEYALGAQQVEEEANYELAQAQGQQIMMAHESSSDSWWKTAWSRWCEFTGVTTLVAAAGGLMLKALSASKHGDQVDTKTVVAQEEAHRASQRLWLMNQTNKVLEQALVEAGYNIGSSRCTKELMVAILVRHGVRPYEGLMMLRKVANNPKAILLDN